MRSVYYSGLARAGLILRSNALAPLRRVLERGRLPQAIARRARRSAASVLLPEGRKWVQVESGLAQGVWLRLNLKDESVYWLGSYETGVQDLLKKLCRPGSTFYDIGANLGFFSFAAAKSNGRSGKVVAFEAEPDNCARFREMAIRNGLQDRVELVEAAVWSYTASAGIPFKRGKHPRAHGGVWADGVEPVLAEGETRTVPAVSLDDFLRGGQPVPDIVKIDVEGGECEVLKGADELFRRAKPTLICEVHRQEAARWIEEWLVAQRYVAEWRVPDELFPRLLVARPV